MLVLALLLVFLTFFLLGFYILPVSYEQSVAYNQKRQRELAKHIEQLMSRQESVKISRIFVLAPIFLSILLVVFMPGWAGKLIGAVFGILIGVVFPGFYIKHLKEKMKSVFGDQLIDALMILSSCLRAGLSLIQALEAVVEEMGDPISKELGIVLGENKMGIALEDSLNYLYNRMGSSALQQMNTAILLARETGGNLPVIFQRISSTIRENKKVQQQLDALTIQSKIQGVVMSILPVVFGFVLYTQDRNMFNLVLTTKEGHMMLAVSFVLWVVGVFLIFRFSRITDY